jgi:predicted membrane chloride channel (bestrophin family)
VVLKGKDPMPSGEGTSKPRSLHEVMRENIKFMWYSPPNRSYLEQKTDATDFTRAGIHFVSWWDVLFNVSARPRCRRPVLFVTLWSCFVTWNGYNKKVTLAGLDGGMSAISFETVTFIVSLLVVFRIGESHKRYLDARAQWGGMVNRSRDLTRQFFGYCDDVKIASKACAWTISFVYACKQSLRWKKEVNEAAEWLDEDELNSLNSARHMPSYCTEQLTR